MPDNKILVSRPYYQGLGLGLETWWPRSWSWSRDLVAKVLVLRPGGQGLGLGLETWWPWYWSWSRAFFKGLDNKSGGNALPEVLSSTSRTKKALTPPLTPKRLAWGVGVATPRFWSEGSWGVAGVVDGW